MTYEFVTMTLKQKPSFPSGSHLIFHVRRRYSKIKPMSRSFYFIFVIVKVLSIISTLLHAKQLIWSTTLDERCNKKKTSTAGGKFWLATSSRQWTCPSHYLVQSFWQKMESLRYFMPSKLRDISPCSLSLFSKIKTSFTQRHFLEVGQDISTYILQIFSRLNHFNITSVMNNSIEKFKYYFKIMQSKPSLKKFFKDIREIAD